MERVIITSFDDLKSYEGKELGVSGDLQITQAMINQFADATLDHQWIHVDTERAKIESPFQNTIAHGYLTVSVLPYLWEQIIEVQNLKLMVNYGIEKLRFSQALIVDNVVRLRASVVSVVNLRGVVKAQINASLEIEGTKKPAYVGDFIFLYHFKD